MNKSIVAALSVVMTACNLSNGSVDDLPLMYDRENSADTFPVIDLPPFDSLPVVRHLPDPFLWADGSGRSVMGHKTKRLMLRSVGFDETR